MSALTNAKLIIDNVMINGHNYRNEKRFLKQLLFPLQCFPCICFSATARILLCPIQCLFNPKIKCNPCFSLLVDSSASMNSDKCIFDRWDDINKKNTISVVGLSNQDMISVISYASEKINITTDVRTKYAIADVVSTITYKFSYIISPTPDDVLNINLKNNNIPVS